MIAYKKSKIQRSFEHLAHAERYTQEGILLAVPEINDHHFVISNGFRCLDKIQHSTDEAASFRFDATAFRSTMTFHYQLEFEEAHIVGYQKLSFGFLEEFQDAVLLLTLERGLGPYDPSREKSLNENSLERLLIALGPFDALPPDALADAAADLSLEARVGIQGRRLEERYREFIRHYPSG